MAASSNNFTFPRFPPPPPPPHVKPPPSPPPSNDTTTTVIVVVFVSFGGIFFLALLAWAVCCFIKKKKKKVEETDLIHVDEHLKVKEAIVEGRHGPKAVVLEVEDDVHVHKDIKKHEEDKFGDGLHKHKILEIGTLPSSSS